MKSPLKAKPLNNPGESLERRLNDVAWDRVLAPVTITILLLVYAALEWIRWYFEIPPRPIQVSAIALGVLIFFTIKIVRAFREIKAIKQGIAGEKAVGQFLERLRTDGAEVFHDVQGDNFNLDHIVIHRSGIYVIETKTMTKPTTGKPELKFDGKQVLRGAKPLQRNPVIQVQAASSWLRQLLEESSGRKFPIKGIVTFPGWFVESNHNNAWSPVWVLNPKALPTYIGNQNAVLSSEDIHLLKFHLGKYVRAG